MTDERDPEFAEPVSQRISQSYRELGAEEPPRALDDEILAAARREAGARPVTHAAHAAQAVRTGRQRWYAPLAAAAVLVLAVAVTLNLQLERPDIAEPKPDAKPPAAASAPSPAPPPAAPALEAQLKLKPEENLNNAAKEVLQEVKPARRKVVEPPAKSAPQAFPAERAPAAASAPSVRSDESRDTASGVTGTLARQMEERASRDAEAAARAPQVGPAQALAKRSEREVAASPAAAPPPPALAKPMSLRERPVELRPERELERIADLRGQGRHDEADKALTEFRKRYPDYRIPEAMRERVERR